jgi:hypothetical protein
MQAQMQAHDHELGRQRSQQEHELLLRAMDEHHANELHELQMAHFRRLAALWQGQEDNPAEYEAILRRNGVLPATPAVPAEEMASGGEVEETPKARVKKALRRAVERGYRRRILQNVAMVAAFIERGRLFSRAAQRPLSVRGNEHGEIFPS